MGSLNEISSARDARVHCLRALRHLCTQLLLWCVSEDAAYDLVHESVQRILDALRMVRRELVSLFEGPDDTAWD